MIKKSIGKKIAEAILDKIVVIVLTLVVGSAFSGLWFWGVKYIEAFPTLKKAVPAMQCQLRTDSILIVVMRAELNWLEDQKTRDSIERATWRRAMEVKTNKLEKRDK